VDLPPAAAIPRPLHALGDDAAEGVRGAWAWPPELAELDRPGVVARLPNGEAVGVERIRLHVVNRGMLAPPKVGLVVLPLFVDGFVSPVDGDDTDRVKLWHGLVGVPRPELPRPAIEPVRGFGDTRTRNAEAVATGVDHGRRQDRSLVTDAAGGCKPDARAERCEAPAAGAIEPRYHFLPRLGVFEAVR